MDINLKFESISIDSNYLFDIRDRVKINTEDKGSRDRNDGLVYRYSEDIIISIKLALVTGRPLLIIGPPGTGKSSLAFNLARFLERRYYEKVVTSSLEANSLLYSIDTVQRLSDAMQIGSIDMEGAHQKAALDIRKYIQPGVLWWIFDREHAKTVTVSKSKDESSIDPCVWRPSFTTISTVLLIDEVDKANDDFISNLLVPFGAGFFSVPEIGARVEFKPDTSLEGWEQNPLIIFTANNENELSEAFIRRCIVLELTPPKFEDLIAIADKLHGKDNAHTEIAKLIVDNSNANTAEYLDTVLAFKRLGGNKELLEKIIKHTTRPSRNI